MQNFIVDYDYPETLGMEIIAGRSHSRDHPSDTLGAFVLNEQAVASLGYASAEDAIGQELIGFNGGLPGPIIGVVRDFHAESLHETIEPGVLMTFPSAFGPAEQTYFYLLVRTAAGRATEAIADIENLWNTLYPAYIYQYSFLDDDVDNLYAADQQLGSMFGGFALLTVVIACLGLFGLASFTAEQRTKEVGVRKVMGASVPGVVFLLTREFAGYVLIAFVIGAPLAFIGMNRWLDSFAYSTELGPLTLIVVGILALVISILTVVYQTIKAASVNPVESLRHE